ncbi:LysR family transcriptional regulator [Sphingomonas sp. HF-S4]|uniref:LysR family transcriptional regulator n=1 Tax=Sphingomonas agrestis TaxID=3080540 RepID=A0ABU3Y3X8_9SPHN|nr:LysR family transcriptional regulator [Sphingomonas sp. HF-S4]MDV3456109.1 LysR family transcriptional regulator [Sphingomonas sp. HF-S4]
MEMQHLHHFIVTAQLGSVGKAADELNLTQSGVSRSIRTLEDLLGLPLFKREARGVSLTEFGRQLLPRAQSIWNARARTLNEMLAYKAMKSGHAEIGLHNVFAYTVAQDVLGRFSAENRDVDITVVTRSDPELSRRLVKEELDFAFSLFVPGFRDPRLIYESLFVMPCGTYAGVNHPLAGGSKLSVEQLADCDWALAGSTSLRTTFSAFFTDRGVMPPGRLVQSSSIALLAQLLGTNAFLTILPDPVAQSPLLVDRLVRIDTVESPASEPEGGLIYRPDLIRTPAVAALMDRFRELAATIG